MPKTISDLGLKPTALASTDVFEIDSGSTTYRVTGEMIRILCQNLAAAGALTEIATLASDKAVMWDVSDQEMKLLPAHSVVNGLRGSESVASGSTSDVVTHGYSSAPSSIQLTLRTSLYNSSEIYVSSITSTNFTVTVDIAPGTAIQYDWQAVL